MQLGLSVRWRRRRSSRPSCRSSHGEHGRFVPLERLHPLPYDIGQHDQGQSSCAAHVATRVAAPGRAAYRSPNGTTLAHRHVRLPVRGKGMSALAASPWLTRRRSAGSIRRSGYSDSYLNDNWILVR